jgi:hypothetical protein
MVIREIPATSSSVIVDTTEPHFASLFFGRHYHQCDYCGGWHQANSQTGASADMHLNDSETGEERKICVRCLIEAFDNILNPICRSKFLAGEIE